MYYKTFISKEDKLKKLSLLQVFDKIENEHKIVRECVYEISLHSIYDYVDDRDKFFGEDINIYLKVNDEIENIKKFIRDFNFSIIDSLPEKVKHILGSYNQLNIKYRR